MQEGGRAGVKEGSRAGVKEGRRAGMQWCILIYCKFMTELWRTSIREKREKVREKDPISEPSAVQWPPVPPVTPHQYI